MRFSRIERSGVKMTRRSFPQGETMSNRNALMPWLIVSLVANAALAGLWFFSAREVRASRAFLGAVMDSAATTVTFPQPPPGTPRDTVYWQWAATSAQMQMRRWEREVQYWKDRRGTLLDPEDLEMLKRNGLADPERALRDSLMAHPEVIPFTPALGGNMSFPPSEIVLLPPPYVYAWAEDGHTGGPLLLRYEVTPDRVTWKTVW